MQQPELIALAPRPRTTRKARQGLARARAAWWFARMRAEVERAAGEWKGKRPAR